MNLLLPHQQDALNEMHNGCILKGATGTGKTITALSYYKDAETPEHLYVITTAKKRDSGDWEAEGRLLGIFPEVDSWQNLDKYQDVKGAFFIFDEQRVIGTGSWVKSFLKITKHNQWVLLSATPGDTWLDYIPVFIAHGFYKNRTQFLEEHVRFSPYTKYPKVTAYLGTEKLARQLGSILVEMPYEKKTIRHEIDVYADYDRDLYATVWRRQWNFLEDRPIRHVSERFALVRRVVNTHPSRLEQVFSILEKHPRIIIFYNFDYELEILRTLCRPETENQLAANVKTGESSGSITATAGEHGSTSTIQKSRESYAVAEWNGHKHEEVPEGDRWIYLVQYAAGSEGWNCTDTDAIIFYSLTYSYKMFEQGKGRIDRIGTSYVDLYYYVVRSSAEIDRGIWHSLCHKQNFNERKFLREYHV